MEPDWLIPLKLVLKEARIQGTMCYSFREFAYAADLLEKDADLLRSLVTQEVPLLSLPQAFEELRQRTNQCKVLVKPNDC
jgi:(R,R)-butanediol dehydrogenase/meso-butanediol dehydrogenase/diacetyl reductase